MARRRQPSWREDPVVLQRLPEVEKRHLRGQSNVAIAAALGVDESTIRNDLRRVQLLWSEGAADRILELKARAVAELDDLRHRALAASEFDQAAECGLLYGEGEPVVGEVWFRGQKAQALNVARQASMDKARVLGLLSDRREHSGAVTVRYESVSL